MDIHIDMRSELAASFRDYTIGELQDMALELLEICAEIMGMESAMLLETTHLKLSENACKRATETALANGDAVFLLLATGIDLAITAIQAIDKTAFMAEVDEM